MKAVTGHARSVSVTNFMMAAVLFMTVILIVAFIPRKSNEAEEPPVVTPQSEIEEETVSYQSDYVSFGLMV